MRREPTLVVLVAAALGSIALGCEGPGRKAPVSESVAPIVGGSVASTCVWPTAVMLIGPIGCTGTLVHPRVVITAKHCLRSESGFYEPPTSIGLGETRDQWAQTVAISQCFEHPDNDFGFCTLAHDVTGIPIVPVMAPCETSELGVGKPVVEVGFGVTSASGRTWGTKEWIGATIDSIDASLVNINVTTGSQDGEYFGDSGGPLFFLMPDRTWRLIGEDCCSPDIGGTGARVSTYTSVPFHVAWTEQQSGVDLTPCHDASGWNPTAACTGFPTDPNSGVGAWNSMCQGELILRQPDCQPSVLDAGAGRDGAEAGSEAGGRDAARDGSVDANPGDSGLADGAPDSEGEGAAETAGEDGTVDSRNSETNQTPPDGGEVGADVPWQSDTGGNGGVAGAGGSPSSTGGSAGEAEGGAGAGAGGSSGAADGGEDGPGAGGIVGGKDGGSEASASDGATDAGGMSAWDGGSGGDAAEASEAGAAGRPIVDGGIDQKSVRAATSGCACRSLSRPDQGSPPTLVLLVLAAGHVIRRGRSRKRRLR